MFFVGAPLPLGAQASSVRRSSCCVSQRRQVARMSVENNGNSSTPMEELLKGQSASTEGADELLGSLNASTETPNGKKRSRATSGTLKASEGRRKLSELIVTHGRGKALKKGTRKEASQQFTQLIADCGRGNLYQLSLDAYAEAVKSIGLDADLCAAAMRAALSAKNSRKALEIYNKACDQKVDLPSSLYSIAVSGLMGCGEVEEAYQFKNALEAEGQRLELFAYNAIIEYYAGKGDLRKVIELLKEIENVGHKMTNHTESLVLRAVFRTGLGLPGCLEWMDEKSYEISRAGLQAMLEESLSLNDRKGASEVLELMRSNGIWAKVRTYNAFIEFFAENDDFVGAFRTYEALNANSISPTSHSYFLLALAAVHSSTNLNEVQSLIDAASEGVQATYHMYNARAILAARRGESPVETFKDMYEEGIAPDEHSFTLAFDAMSRREEKDMVQAALESLRLMDSMGLLGSRKSMNALFKVLAKGGAAPQAVELYQQMSGISQKHSAMTPDYETYELVLEACGNGKRMDLAVGVFRELEENQVRPTVAMYSVLIQGFGNCRDLESALGVWKEMKSRGLRPNRTAYRRMIDACLKHRNGLLHACTTMEEMTAMGFSLEQEYYDTLISGYGRARELEKQLMNKFRSNPGASYQMDEVTFGAMLSACGKSEDMPTVEEAIDRMLHQGFRPDKQVLEYLADGRAVSNSKNKVIQDLFGISGVDIAREYLPSYETDEYIEFNTLLEGKLKEPEPEPPVEETIVAEEKKVKELQIREKALERPPNGKSERERSRRRLKNRRSI